MADFEFEATVTVRVTGWPATVPVYDDGYVRLPQDLARQAAYEGDIYEANRKDGWADFPDGCHATITSAEVT